MNLKTLTCAVVMEVLYRGIRSLATTDSRVMYEIARLPQGCVISFAVSEDDKSPRLTFTLKDGTIKKVKSEKYDVEIIFKSVPSAFRVFTGQMSVASAYAAHAFYLFGNINTAMGIVRIVDIAESCLFPHVMTKRILTNVYKREVPMVLTYLSLPFFG
jgi:hypothetical protein